ncbi:MAG: translation initiation factor IF-2 subunit beta [Halobacteriales archaeon]
MDYDASLDRAMDSLPEYGSDEDRLLIPDADAQTDGAFTRLTNLSDIADVLSRDPDHVHRFLQQELGTHGELSEGVGRYAGDFSAEDFDAAIDAYVEQFVRCSECGLPDTRLVTEGRTQMLRCDACGAFRPVDKRATRQTSQEQREAVEEGKTYDLQITGTGRKGDGVAERGEYTIFVTGAQEGETVRALVESVSGNLAFARKV